MFYDLFYLRKGYCASGLNLTKDNDTVYRRLSKGIKMIKLNLSTLFLLFSFAAMTAFAGLIKNDVRGTLKHPIIDKRFRKNGRWDDDLSMIANNTSAFNYQLKTGGTTLSNHATGTAIDITPCKIRISKAIFFFRRTENTIRRRKEH